MVQKIFTAIHAGNNNNINTQTRAIITQLIHTDPKLCSILLRLISCISPHQPKPQIKMHVEAGTVLHQPPFFFFFGEHLNVDCEAGCGGPPEGAGKHTLSLLC